jgi:SAM-dependent methyltransferase
VNDAVLWHDVECASYGADLPLWRELATERGGPVLELGCGTGRVTLDLAERGHSVTGLDAEAALVDALLGRARGRGLRVDGVIADARSFSVPQRFALIVAPMQVVQLLGGRRGRRRMLEAARRHLESGGLLAAALADPFEGVPADEALPPLPDVREEEGWVLSSRPVGVRAEPGAVTVDRARQAVSPAGELSESVYTVRLDVLTAGELAAEAKDEGFRALPERRVPETRDHVGSTAVLLEAPKARGGR